MAGIAMGLQCPVCAAEDRADSEYESARSDNKADGAFQAHPQGGVLFGTPLRRGSSEYHPCQVRHRRRFLRAAKNHAVATRRLLGQAPSLIGDPISYYQTSIRKRLRKNRHYVIFFILRSYGAARRLPQRVGVGGGESDKVPRCG